MWVAGREAFPLIGTIQISSLVTIRLDRAMTWPFGSGIAWHSIPERLLEQPSSLEEIVSLSVVSGEQDRQSSVVSIR